MMKHENFGRYIETIEPGSIFVEIGGERGEGSTRYLSDLAKSFSTRLFSVDIVSLEDNIKLKWEAFYKDVRDPTWPKFVLDIEDLSGERKNECIHQHGWLEIKKNIIENFIVADNVVRVHESGSVWSKNYGKNHKEPISLLYLDNFDYIWNISDVADFIKDQIKDYKNYYQIEMNNQNCQIEHLTQLLNLYPFLTENCLVGFDDTYQYNDCWIGKSGPGVVFLLSKGWQIIFKDPSFVIMRRT